jgi:hypothetical protein
MPHHSRSIMALDKENDAIDFVALPKIEVTTYPPIPTN